jgi:uncharacterized protein
VLGCAVGAAPDEPDVACGDSEHPATSSIAATTRRARIVIRCAMLVEASARVNSGRVSRTTEPVARTWAGERRARSMRTAGRARLPRMYQPMFAQMKKQLGQLEKMLDTAEAHAKSKSFEPTLFLAFRLAPDQFSFARQVQITCDTAKLAASRLTGKEAPSNADTEQTLEELRARVRGTVAYLDGITAKDFEGAAARSITQPRWEGKTLSGADYFVEHAVPNFYFHLTTAYAILRHNGVSVGKKDYLGALSFRAPA